MAYKYSTELTQNCAKGVGVALPISRKESVMVCQAIRGMQVGKAKKLLEDVVALKKPIAFTRYNMDMGHKHGIAAGRFPVSACSQILKLLQSVEANAQFKGLSTAGLIVRHASAQKGPTAYHSGRQRTKAKRTHIELVVEEKKQEAKK
ncbi:50S ribosomal protein L22 [Candidatus Woesearchaeota archaeon]|nr:50S ribosomal protein L22 [Candidatus Woesearchaeota archaeon]